MNTKLAKRGLVGLGAVVLSATLAVVPAFSASAAIVPTVGSAHPFYLVDLGDGSALAAGTVKGWNDDVAGNPQASDPDFTHAFAIPSGTATARTFISPRGQESNISAWNAYGPLGTNTGNILFPNMKPSANTSTGLGSPSGSGGVANAGGDYSLGIAFLDMNNHVIETDFTFITVTANANANLATWTFDVPVPATPKPNFASFAATSGASAVVGATAVQFDATSANANKTVDVWLEGATAKAATLTLDASGKAIYTSISGLTAGTRLALTDSGSAPAVVDAWITAAAVPAPTTAPTSTTDAATQVTVANPASGATTITVPAGAGNANKTFNVYAWSTPTSLGQVTTDASGNATVDVSSLAPGVQHTVALTDPNTGTYAAWGTFTLTSPTAGSSTVSADVTNSGKFALEGVAAAINLTPAAAVARGATTTAVPLGAIKVTDDRNALLGWTLKADATDFTSGSNTIAKSALGIAPAIVSGVTDGITLGAAQVAGSASYPVATLAQATAGYGTLAVGTSLNADLTFKAPNNAVSGTYTSTLTLTLASK
ncbi:MULTISPECIES: hypothetical protein [Microbacterium]|jgi:hypothetical protein|uniref:hypothetical protein n=1 Tax=Microbacterium TaxID=33882 RepID=UPI0006FA7423|nr:MULTISPECIES: hypothetical protein [unclassified Microbacterium]KQR92766.1 hypothetical protein ASF93_04560 [Microbacterium sp. Leaf347]MBN9199003.1 hypothetical protein [Microbacterium ginsengisoli]MCK9916617.1 hypothetical protein [Microbacteriaceae bacterium K1510]OJU76220.1 MAG: hypothetical protein BGO15_05510 [Microbacterium sp. 71-23]